jgi:hypothetical protein
MTARGAEIGLNRLLLNLLLGLTHIAMGRVRLILDRLIGLLLQLLRGGRQCLGISGGRAQGYKSGSAEDLFHHGMITNKTGTLFLKDRMTNL